MIRLFQNEMFHSLKGAYFSFKKKSTKRNLPFCMPVFSNTPRGLIPPIHTPRGPAHLLGQDRFRFIEFAGQAPPLHIKFRTLGNMAGKKAFPIPAQLDYLKKDWLDIDTDTENNVAIGVRFVDMIRIFENELFHLLKGAYFSFKKKSTKRNLPFCMPVFSNTPRGLIPPIHTPRGPAHLLGQDRFRFIEFAGQAPPLLEKFRKLGKMASKKAFPFPARMNDSKKSCIDCDTDTDTENNVAIAIGIGIVFTH